MKGIRFYEEFENKRKKVSAGNVIALEFGNGYHPGTSDMGAIGAVYDYPNSPVAGTATNRDYLSAKCRRIPESRARQIHPSLFWYLEAE